MMRIAESCPGKYNKGRGEKCPLHNSYAAAKMSYQEPPECAVLFHTSTLYINIASAYSVDFDTPSSLHTWQTGMYSARLRSSIS